MGACGCEASGSRLGARRGPGATCGCGSASCDGRSASCDCGSASGDGGPGSPGGAGGRRPPQAPRLASLAPAASPRARQAPSPGGPPGGRRPARPGEMDPRRVAPCGNGVDSTGALWPRSPRRSPSPGAAPRSARLTRLGDYDTTGSSTGAKLFAMLDRRRGGSHTSAGQVLSPRGANCPRQASRSSATLLPGAIVFPGRVTQPVSPAAAAGSPRQLPANLRGLALAMAGPRAAVGGATAMPQLVPVSPFGVVSPPWTPAEASATDPWGGGSAPAAEPPPCGAASWGEALLGRQVVVRYADIEFCVDEDWLLDKEERGGWMGADEVIEILWANALGHGEGVDRDVFAGMVDCWMIDLRKATSGRSYSSFFANKGGPWEFLYYTCELVSRYASLAKESWSGVDTCEHFHNFVGNVIRGNDGTSRSDEEGLRHGPCPLRIRAVSSTTDVRPRTVQTCDDPAPNDCHGYAPDGQWWGGQFDDWDATLQRYPLFGEPSWLWTEASTGSRTQGVSTSALASATMSAFAVNIPATRLAFDGFIADWLMYWARAALQFALEAGSWSHLSAAWGLARGVLARMTALGNTVIHELGHLYMGVDGHCDCEDAPPDHNCRCCFDMAAQAWQVRLQARLGLPATPTFTCSPAALSFTETEWNCSTGGVYPWTQAIAEPCVADSPVWVEARRCSVVP